MDEKDKIKILVNGVYSAVSNLNSFIFVSAGLLVLIVSIKLFSKDKTTFKVPKIDIEIPWNKVWIILVAYTVGHFYFSFILNQRLEKLTQEKPEQEEKEIVWKSITDGDKGGFIFNGMEKRISANRKNLFGFNVYTMRKTDITTWISLGISLLLFISVFDFKASLKGKLLSTYIGLLICIINWTIGSWWATNISTLTP